MSENTIYKGGSEGFSYLVSCYDDYAKEVITKRAIADLRDGLKPVNRRILYSLKQTDSGTLQKCSTLVGEAMKLHPHGDSSVYGAFALMTDENASYNIPLFQGLGNLGRVYLSTPPAAMRYPKAKLNTNAEDFFKDAEVMDLIPAEEGDGKEPTVLNVNYPVVLVNGTDGIAVAAASKIPSFNFGDVIDLTVTYLQNGNLSVEDSIVPDFPTGGILVKNDAELSKIMLSGQGKLKLRAKVEIVNKEIRVLEVPFGKTIESIIRLINKAEIREIAEVDNSLGRNSDCLITITCKNKKSVEYVLMELYRRNILQSIFSSNMLLINNGEPVMLGVHDVIRKWCDWRRSVVRNKFEQRLKGIESRKMILDYFLRLISNKEWKDTYIDKSANGARNEDSNYLREIFEDIPKEAVDWITDRKLRVFNNGGKYAKEIEELKETETLYLSYVADPDLYIIPELENLKVMKNGQYERKTQVTYTDYKFSKISESEVIEDTSYCVYTFFENGFLKKTRNFIKAEGVMNQFEGQANDTLVGFDIYGRILRVSGTDIDFMGEQDNGVFLPKYFDVTNPDILEEYKILYMGLLDGTTRTLVYRDGYVGFLDTSEWVGKKKVRVVDNGVCRAVIDKLLHVYEEKDLNQVIVVADDSESKIKLGAIMVSDIKMKSRTSRTKVLDGTRIDYKYLNTFSYIDYMRFVEDPEQYVGKYKKMKGDFLGDPSLMEDGRYLEICKDFEEA